MTKTVVPLSSVSPKPFVASIPGSKSFTNRALVIAAQHLGETRITKALHCEDTEYLAACLDQFDGLEVVKTADGFRVNRSRERLGAPIGELYVGGAGTPARFLLAFATMADGPTVVTGNKRLCERPMGDLLRAFDRMGVRYECLAAPDCLPIRIFPSQIETTEWSISGEVSSQFTSSLLLLAAQQPKGPIRVTATGKLVSKSYVDMTVQMLQRCGVSSRRDGTQSFVIQPGRPSADSIDIEADASGMSYFLAAAAMTKSHVIIPNIGRDSAQGDLGFAGVLKEMGCDVRLNADSVEILGGKLRGIDIDMEDMPDTVLTLAAVASQAAGATHISNIANLRVKECDRIHAAVQELRRLGVATEERADAFSVKPNGATQSATVHTYNDHRVAMAFGLLGLIHPGIHIENPDCVAKSFPEFWQELDRFRAHHESREVAAAC